MKKFLKATPVVIVSASRAHLNPASNLSRTRQAAAYLREHGVPFRRAHGKCGGEIEHVFIVPAEHGFHARQVARSYDQDAILYVDGERVAGLGHREDQYAESGAEGMFTEVPAWEAEQEDYYTLVDGRYFVIRD